MDDEADALIAVLEEDARQWWMTRVLPQLVFHVRVAGLKLRRFTLAQLIQVSGWPASPVEWELGSLVRQGFVDPLPPDR